MVLNRLSFERINENETDEWDLLWAHDYPFTKLRANLSVLKPHQRVNHFPGCGFITNKVDLSTTDLKYIPKAFKLPGDVEKFKEFAIKNPEKHFVVVSDLYVLFNIFKYLFYSKYFRNTINIGILK